MAQHIEIPSKIETERLILRQYQPEDAAAYYRISQKNQIQFVEFETSNAARGLHCEEDAEALIRDFIGCWEDRKAFFMGAFLKETREFAAQVYIGVVNWDLPEFEIGYFADVDHEGKGYVTEAVKGALGFLFNDLNAHKVRLECDETNVRSIRVAERCGFVKEGLIRETKKRADGTFTGDIHYGLLRREYFLLARPEFNIS